MAKNRSILSATIAFWLGSTAIVPAVASAGDTTTAGTQSAPYETRHNGRVCQYSDKEIVEDNVIEPRDATDMVGMFPCWEADEDNEQSRDLNGFYAHWSIRQIRGPTTRPRGYPLEARSKILRLFVGRDLSVLSSLRIEMRDPDTTIVVPLAHFGYQGRAGKPELWTTELVGDNQSSTFFRIEPNTTANIVLKADSTNAVEVKAAGTVLDALTRIASIANAGTGLLTTLNKDSIQQTSRALDNALSSIWSNSQGEEQASGRMLSEWYPGARYILKVSFPGWVRPSSYDRTKLKSDQRFVRWYELTLSCPRYSIFNSDQACGSQSETEQNGRAAADSGITSALAKLKTRIAPEQVINFRLSSGKKLQEHLASFDWYGRFLRLAGSPTSQKVPVKKEPALQAQLLSENGGTGAGGGDAPAPGAPPPPATDPQTPTTTEKPVTAESIRTRGDQDYAALCNSIVNELYAVGLSRLDAQIGLWAVISGSSDFVGTVVDFQTNTTCRHQLPAAGTSGIWWFISSNEADTPPGSGADVAGSSGKSGARHPSQKRKR